MSEPMTPARLAEIAARHKEYKTANSLAALNLAGVAIERDIPALLAEVARLEAEVARLRDAELVAWLMARKPYGQIPFIEFSRNEDHPSGAFYFAHKKSRQYGCTVTDSSFLNAVSRNTPLPVLTDAAREIAAAARATTDAKEAGQ